MANASYIRNGQWFGIVEWPDRDRVDVVRRSVNAKTGKPWQASKLLATFSTGERHKAMRCWLYAHRRLQS